MQHNGSPTLKNKESPSTLQNDYSDLKANLSSNSKKKKKQDQYLGLQSNSKGSVAISMRDESILQMSINDERH
jgi:hypothetical protein